MNASNGNTFLTKDGFSLLLGRSANAFGSTKQYGCKWRAGERNEWMDNLTVLSVCVALDEMGELRLIWLKEDSCVL